MCMFVYIGHICGVGRATYTYRRHTNNGYRSYSTIISIPLYILEHCVSIYIQLEYDVYTYDIVMNSCCFRVSLYRSVFICICYCLWYSII